MNIKFVYPKRTMPLSVTGEACALNCHHCKGHYLKHMKNLWNVKEVPKKKVGSYLVSGGCNSEGAVPLSDNLDLLKTLSEKYKVIVHTGLIKKEDVTLISPFIHAASFNLIGDDSTIREIYNLRKNTDDFMKSYEALRNKVDTYPHITIGLHRGIVKGEYHALDSLSKLGAKVIVFNVFIPTPSTDFEDIMPPSLKAVSDVINYAKEIMNGTRIYLGCMRPFGEYREKLDQFCLKTGVDRIVMPSKSARQLAKNLGYEITESSECCII